MYLQDDARQQSAFAQLAVYGDHRQFHDVGRAALDRGVDRVALGQPADDRIARTDVRQHPLASEQRADVAGFAGFAYHVLHVFFDAREGGEISVDDRFRFGARNLQPLGEPESGDAVNDAEVGRFGLPPLFARYVGRSDAEDSRGGRRVDIGIVREGVDHDRVRSPLRCAISRSSTCE